METTFVNAVVYIATGAAVIKFALFEWEGVRQAWRRATAARKRRARTGSQIADYSRRATSRGSRAGHPPNSLHDCCHCHAQGTS